MKYASLILLLGLTACIQREVYPPAPICHKSPPCCGELMARVVTSGRPVQRGGLETNTQVIGDHGVGSSRVFLKMKEGELWMMGGSQDLLDASLKYPSGENPPLLLSVTAGTSRQINMESGGNREEWHLALNNQIPVSLAIQAEGGNRDLKLKDIPISQLVVEALQGTTLASLTGDQLILSLLDISHDRGNIGLNLSGNYPILTKASIYTAYGDVGAKLTGYYPRLDQVDITSVQGNVELDLRGAWRRICHLKVRATCGDCFLCIPCGLGVSVKVFKDRCGRVCAPTLKRKWASDAYVSDAYGKGEGQSFLDIEVYITEGDVYIQEN